MLVGNKNPTKHIKLFYKIVAQNKLAPVRIFEAKKQR